MQAEYLNHKTIPIPTKDHTNNFLKQKMLYLLLINCQGDIKRFLQVAIREQFSGIIYYNQKLLAWDQG